MNSHDVGRGRGGLEAALARFTGELTVVAVDSDRLYPPRLTSEIVALRPGTREEVIASRSGHDGFLTETEQLQDVFTHYLDAVDLNGRGEPHLPQEKASGLCSADVGSTRPFTDAFSAEPYARGQKVAAKK